MAEHDKTPSPPAPKWTTSEERRLRKAAEIAHLGYWDADFQNNIFYHSTEYAVIHGLPANARVTRQEQVYDMILPGDRDRVEAFFIDVDQRMADYQVEYRIARADTGETAFIEEIGEVVRDDNGTPLGHTGVTRDITRERAIQSRLQEALGRAESDVRSRDNFLANMSHELRTPLNAICGYSELLTAQPEPISGQAGIILQAARHLTEIIEDILIQAEAGSDSLKVSAQEIEILPFLTETAAIAGLPPGQMGPRGRLKVEPENAVARFDKRLIAQALINVLSNARKYGGDDVSVAVDFTQTEGYWRFRIWDDGIGIPDAELSRITEPFYRGTNAKRAAVQGTGLGLSLTRKIVEAHGGRFDVRSWLNQGTRVDLILPIVSS